MKKFIDLIGAVIELLFAIIGTVATILLTLAAMVVPVVGVILAIGGGDPAYLLWVVTAPIFLFLASFIWRFVAGE